MRDRNSIRDQPYLWSSTRLYLTYEGSKLDIDPDGFYERACLYLTYEGSKLGKKISGIISRFCLYLTYEGSKPTISSNVSLSDSLVCILPMRDRNIYQYSNFPILLEWFVSYLWGIETSINYNWTCQVLMFVSYLWGIETQTTWRSRLPITLFVSYLWGIETLVFHNSITAIVSLYLTYEGSKHSHNSFMYSISSCLYLTYEGSKHEMYNGADKNIIGRFVSYLWGIETLLQ